MKSLGNREFVLTKKYFSEKGVPIKKPKKFSTFFIATFILKKARYYADFQESAPNEKD
jgi:hypothetical protein